MRDILTDTVAAKYTNLPISYQTMDGQDGYR